jgi:hypothetical protein
LDDRVWKNISIVLGVVCAVLIGIAGALMVVHKSGASAASNGPDSSQIAQSTPTATVPGSTPSGTAGQGPTPTPTPGPAVQGTPGTITFTGLALDAANDKNGNARTFTFVSDGAGPVTFAVTKSSGGASIKMCAKVDTGGYGCKVGAKPNFLQGVADGPHNTWTVVLNGYGATTPTADVTFTWPAVSHKITLTHGRLQGTGAAEALNGLTATFKPPSAGALNVQASWTTISADVEMTLSDISTPPAVTVDHRQYGAATSISPAYNFNVDSAKTYELKLRNTSADNGRPDLTLQLIFP